MLVFYMHNFKRDKKKFVPSKWIFIHMLIR